MVNTEAGFKLNSFDSRANGPSAVCIKSKTGFLEWNGPGSGRINKMYMRDSSCQPGVGKNNSFGACTNAGYLEWNQTGSSSGKLNPVPRMGALVCVGGRGEGRRSYSLLLISNI